MCLLSNFLPRTCPISEGISPLDYFLWVIFASACCVWALDIEYLRSLSASKAKQSRIKVFLRSHLHISFQTFQKIFFEVQNWLWEFKSKEVKSPMVISPTFLSIFLRIHPVIFQCFIYDFFADFVWWLIWQYVTVFDDFFMTCLTMQ